jgi:Hemerythrin HHE cation binding domain
MPAPGTQFIDELLEEHDRIHVLFDSLFVADADDRPSKLEDLVGSIVKHEVAEEVVVYPVAQQTGAAGYEVCETRLSEHHALDLQLLDLEGLDVGSAKFETLLVEIERAVHLHTAYEELTLLEPLRWAVPDEQLVELRRQYEAVRIAAPSHPYPDGDPTVLTRRTSVRAGLLALLRRVRDAKSP